MHYSILMLQLVEVELIRATLYAVGCFSLNECVKCYKMTICFVYTKSK